jgi:hypothetical protein
MADACLSTRLHDPEATNGRVALLDAGGWRATISTADDFNRACYSTVTTSISTRRKGYATFVHDSYPGPTWTSRLLEKTCPIWFAKKDDDDEVVEFQRATPGKRQLEAMAVDCPSRLQSLRVFRLCLESSKL